MAKTSWRGTHSRLFADAILLDGCNLQHFDCVSQMSLKYRCNYILTVDCCYFTSSLFSTVSYWQITRAIRISRTISGFGFFFPGLIVALYLENG